MRRILALCRHDWRAHKQAFFLLGIFFSFFLLRFPSLFEPSWYGDEGIYQTVAMALRDGRLLYQGIWDNKPPLLYLIYALFGSDLFSIRLVSLLFGLASTWVFFFLAKQLFKKRTSYFFATGVFALLFATPLLEGNIANAENFMLLPILGSALLILSNHDRQSVHKIKQIFLAGILLATAFLMKVVAIFDLATYIFFLFFLAALEGKMSVKKTKAWVVKETILILAFLIPTAVTIVFFVTKGVLPDFLAATLAQNISYVAYSNTLFETQGFLIIKIVLLGLFLLLLFLYRHLFTKQQIFILLWIAFSLFNAFFAQRPYTHYLLTLLPSLALLAGEILETKKFRFVGLLIVIFILSLIPKNFWIYGKVDSYYKNFIQFVNNQKTVDGYQAFFDPATPGYYEVAQFVTMHTNEKEGVFFWGNAAQLYVLSHKLPPGRLTVAYHITFYPEAEKETKRAIDTKRPKYIILLMPIAGHEAFLHDYTLRFILSKGAVVYERAG